jgi:hypothetical protein
MKTLLELQSEILPQDLIDGVDELNKNIQTFDDFTPQEKLQEAYIKLKLYSIAIEVLGFKNLLESLQEGKFE